jgi:hypothetical protein
VNREFVKKLIKAEILKYEAFKEILPDELKKKVNCFEKEAVVFLKDIALEMIKENISEDCEGSKRETKKIKVDFS